LTTSAPDTILKQIIVGGSGEVYEKRKKKKPTANKQKRNTILIATGPVDIADGPRWSHGRVPIYKIKHWIPDMLLFVIQETF